MKTLSKDDKSKVQITERWSDYFQELMGQRHEQVEIQEPQNETEKPEVEINEMQQSIRKFKNEKPHEMAK